jgi:NADH dehydrogenase/NADH:ubiquinone oxidoreductase subunit G
MSTYQSYSYSIERERRREIARRRVRDTTWTFAQRYQETLNQVRDEECYQYVAREHADLSHQIARLMQLLEDDPFEARDLSVRLGDRIFGLSRLAREKRRVAIEAEREAERLRKEELQRGRAELESVWQQELSAWGDAESRSSAFGALADIRKRLMGSDATTTVEQLRAAVGVVKSEHERKARELKEEIVQAARSEGLAHGLQVCRERLEQMKGVDAAGFVSMTRMLEGSEKLRPLELADRLSKINEELDSAVDEETCRKEVVKDVSSALQDAGFVVQSPRRLRDNGKDEVVIRASRPAGAQAEFRVELNGRMNFRFDRYRGSACKQDIEKVLPRLQSVYGIRLSDQCVLWENPDDKDVEERPQPPIKGGSST